MVVVVVVVVGDGDGNVAWETDSCFAQPPPPPTRAPTQKALFVPSLSSFTPLIVPPQCVPLASLSS